MDSPQPRYKTPQRLLHWLTVLLVLTTIPAGLVMVQDGLPRAVQNTLFFYHKNIGPVILLVVLLRIAIRAVLPHLPHPDSLPRLQAFAAEAVHALLYLALVAMALSGIVRVKAGAYPIELWDPLFDGLIGRNEALARSAEAFHGKAWIVVVLLVTAHAGAAALHGLMKKDGIFSRMWPPV
ncbi:cytochrome b [Salipiger aestuarii]|uniref:Cytochrome b561 n=1 Tax=Salipiger aestuarii TaxID=568098 RepID=A0A327YSC5_9RHOB|nr:cytochrome b/b6 domain-containing protein [Salipiger aestuarii]EIE49557.1 cytochrome B561 [Citreicella sp. 357]KAA8610144.1 cytochrome b [Salipiger aestuarii]KAA8616048.1 cytochrome b [Salipiger aestuarii]KAB2543343.1 cytochrome b [Salipiger aestuarii]RAK23988.1 cytochrome b561 [Salipiger aestuarii]